MTEDENDQLSDRPWMTEEQAEDIVMAAEVGVFRGRPSELAHARLLLSLRKRRSDGQSEVTP
jgi:hypothetical protein